MTIHAKVTAVKSNAGLDHGLAIGTSVLCLDGMLPVEYLHPGDSVITRTGARKLVAIEISVVQNARVIRISAGVLGKDRPADDMIVTPNQLILIRDWRAQALTGAKVALIPAARLVDGEYIRAEVLPELRLYTLRFDEDVVIYAGDLELVCTSATITA